MRNEHTTPNMSLREDIGKLTKDNLKLYAYNLEMTGFYGLKKADLAKAVADKLLDPKTVFYRMSIYDDRAIALFEKGIGEPYKYKDDEFDKACELNEITYICMDNDTFVVYADVAEVWSHVKDKEFDKYRRKASWIRKCLFWAEEMYGVTPVEVFLDVVNIKKGMNVTAEELSDIFAHMPLDMLYSVMGVDVIIDSTYIDDEDAAKELMMAQRNKDFYIPTVDEIEELFDTCALISGSNYRNMKQFLISEVDVDPEDAEDILVELWDMLSSENDFHDTMQWLWDQFEFKNDQQIEKAMKLYMPLANGTRMRTNRGHTPEELFSKSKFEPGHMPVITAGSSEMAKMLNEAAPEIRKMGFGLDLESNAADIPVINMPNGINGPMQFSTKKVYPNDPCPCGSGKKYKKCCGRTQGI